MNDHQFAILLKIATRAARDHARLSAEITGAFEERYGTTHSAVDCDYLIDVLDYGLGQSVTLKQTDAAMAECGAPRINDGKDDGDA